MNRIITICAAILMTASIFAQTPEKMSYQAVIRDSANELVANTEVGMQISILQGSILEVVYQETQASTTNANGLVSLEIGTGTTSDYFSFINWANGPYFIKTETDPTGGTNYSITGTSQLMSVPYALYAKESGSSTSPNLQTVLAENNSANNQQIKNLQDPTDEQDAVTKAYTYSKAEVDVLMYDLFSEINYIIPQPPQVGDYRDGGVVFYVAPTPTDLNGDGIPDQGLVCAIQDQSTGIVWGSPSNTSGALAATGIGTGQANTIAIINNQGAGNYAASVCDDYSVTIGATTYDDWFLPSKEELNFMYQNKATINATATAGTNGGSGFDSASYYWSSTEYGFNYAWLQYFGNGLQSSGGLKYFADVRVRAIRAF